MFICGFILLRVSVAFLRGNSSSLSGTNWTDCSMNVSNAVRWIICFLYTIVVTVLSLIPSSDLPRFPIPHLDKIGHFGLYGLYALLLVWTLRIEAPSRRACFLVGLFCVGYGVAMEILQKTLCHSGRQLEIGDIVANTIGVVGAILFTDWYYRQGNAAAQTPADAGR